MIVRDASLSVVFDRRTLLRDGITVKANVAVSGGMALLAQVHAKAAMSLALALSSDAFILNLDSIAELTRQLGHLGSELKHRCIGLTDASKAGAFNAYERMAILALSCFKFSSATYYRKCLDAQRRFPALAQ